MKERKVYISQKKKKKLARPDVKLLKAKGSSRRTGVAKTGASDGGRREHATQPSSSREEQRGRKAAPPLLKAKGAPRFTDRTVT